MVGRAVIQQALDQGGFNRCPGLPDRMLNHPFGKLISRQGWDQELNRALQKYERQIALPAAIFGCRFHQPARELLGLVEQLQGLLLGGSAPIPVGNRITHPPDAVEKKHHHVRVVGIRPML